MADVFISYARDDRETAAKLAEVLEDQGYSVWWDPVIPPGKKWAEIIGTQLGAARCVVVLWSAVSVEKRWVRKEASFADARNKLIPARLEDVTIPFEFADVQAADLTDWQGDHRHAGFQHLASAISEQLRKPTSKHPKEDIVVATEQAKEQLAETQATAKTEKLSVRAAWDRFSAYVRMQDWQTLLSKRTIIIGGVVVLAISLFMLASQEAGQKAGQERAVTAPSVTDAPVPGGMNNGAANVVQPGQTVDSANPTTERNPEPAPTMTTGSIIVVAEEKGAIFSVHDGDGQRLVAARVNNPVSLFRGNYKVKINGSEREASVEVGQEARLETGSIIVLAEEEGAIFSVHDGDGQRLVAARVNNPVSMFRGNYKVKTNGSESEASVTVGQEVRLETGSIIVVAEEKGAIFSVHDGDGQRLAAARVNDPVSLFPGTYRLQFRGSERIVSVQAGQRTF